MAQTYTFKNAFGDFGNGTTPCFLTSDKTGRIFVADLTSTFDNGRIEVFNNDGTFVRNIGVGMFLGEPLGITLDSQGNLYTTDYIHAIVNGRIMEFDSAGNFKRVVTSTKPLPYGLALDKSGNIYVEDNFNRIQKFDNNGNLITEFGIVGSNNVVGTTQDMKFDSKGSLYVTDCNNALGEYNTNGTLLRTIGSGGSGNGQFNTATGIAFDTIGNIYASDFINNRIVEFSNSGDFIQNIGIGELKNPWGLTFDPRGNLFVADRGNNRIVEFGTSLTSVAPEPSSSALLTFAALPLIGFIRRRKV